MAFIQSEFMHNLPFRQNCFYDPFSLGEVDLKTYYSHTNLRVSLKPGSPNSLSLRTSTISRVQSCLENQRFLNTC